MKRADQYSRYSNFTNKRDAAAERFLFNAQLKQTDILRYVLFQVMQEVQTYLMNTHRDHIETLNARLAQIFHSAVIPIMNTIQTMRKHAYILAYTSEAEALAQLTGKGTYDIKQEILSQSNEDKSSSGGRLSSRISFYLDKLRRKLIERIHLSVVTNEEFKSAIKKAARTLPRALFYSQPPKVLRRIKEAAQDEAPDIAVGFVSDAEWQEMVDDYLNEYDLAARGPEDILPDYVIDALGLGEKYAGKDPVYEWEVEQEVTNEFVKAVRDGQIASAKENNVQDFVWIAVLDKKTCEDCCVPRDGMTTNEIEAALKSGELDADACDAVNPPGHFNCRCRIAPVLEGFDEPIDTGTKEFDTWLNS